MADLPLPPVPPDADLTDFKFMPLEVERLRRSRAWLICKRRISTQATSRMPEPRPTVLLLQKSRRTKASARGQLFEQPTLAGQRRVELHGLQHRP